MERLRYLPPEGALETAVIQDDIRARSLGCIRHMRMHVSLRNLRRVVIIAHETGNARLVGGLYSPRLIAELGETVRSQVVGLDENESFLGPLDQTGKLFAGKRVQDGANLFHHVRFRTPCQEQPVPVELAA